MFGYVRIRKPELLVKDYECYKGFYCGLCHSLRDTYGLRGQVTLTYDMTFLVLLLSSVYDLAVKEEYKRCIINPAGKRRVIRTEAADYAADINMLLSYYHFVDDKQDEHSLAASLGVQMYRGQSRRLEQHYPRQARAIAEASFVRAGRLQECFCSGRLFWLHACRSICVERRWIGRFFSGNRILFG